MLAESVRGGLLLDPLLNLHIDQVSTVEEASTCLAKHDYQAVLAQLGGVNGGDPLDQAARLRLAGGDTPLMVVTRAGEKGMATELLAAGAEDVLAEEELTPALMVRVVRYAMERKRVRDLARTSEDELRRGRSDLADFEQILSHDLKTPLAVVRMEIEAAIRALRDPRSPNAGSDELASARREIDQVTVLIDDLTRFTRLGRNMGEFKTLALEALVQHAMDRVLATLPDAQEVEVSLELADDLPKVQGAPTRLLDLFVHLLGNAMTYRGVAPLVIRIGARRIGKRVAVSVSDNGMGIPEADRLRVLSIFERVQGRPHAGSGIGLAIAQRTVDLHGGTLTISHGHGPADASLAEPGAAFHFTLPAAN